jgi:ketosteroid isomerase-like protein
MNDIVFATPEEAEQEFYRAFEQHNLDAMRGVWSNAQYIECIHPMGPRLQGPDAVVESWREIFANATAMHFEIVPHNYTRTAQIAIHSVLEKIHLPDSQQQPAAMVATNIFELTEDGWRMILHHASPMRPIEHSEPGPSTDATLH